MHISIRKGNLLDEEADLLAVGRGTGKSIGGAYAALNERLGGLLEEAGREEGFSGESGTSHSVRTAGLIPARRVLVVGLGAREASSEERVRVAAAQVLNAAKAAGAKRVVSVLFGAGGGGIPPRACGKAMAEGIRLADYVFGRYKKESKPSPKSIVILTTDGKKARAANEGLAVGEGYARAATYARDLVNTPGQHMRPIDLVEAARALAKADRRIKIKVYDRADLERMGAGGILGVNQGSDHEPYLVHLQYEGGKAGGREGGKAKGQKRICLVGKAVTFDSGGLSIKPASGMETMKCDMAGAAAVLGTFSVMGATAPRAEVHGIFAAVENMPSGKAIRPGDVVTIMNGKTMEIRNTDAEGRVTLADALTFAARLKPHAIVDLATLTGACVVALGEEYTGLMSNNDALAARVLDAAKLAGENMWRLPLPDEYRELIKTDIADYKNDAPRWGGSLTAGLLLQEFVEGIPWVHLDIAGPAFAERPINAYTKKGATGHGARTLLEYVSSY